MKLQELQRLTQILNKHPQIIVISDDVYYLLPFDNKPYNMFALLDNNFHKTITIFSAGKMLNATGWKIGWIVGPEQLMLNISMAHEVCVYNNNVPGQIALAYSFDQCFKPYNGYKNYFDFVRGTFQKARDEALKLTKLTKQIVLNPTNCEGGYFLPIEISQNKHLIPEKYFKNQNYEDDPNTLVIQRRFQNRSEVPLDYAFCR